MLPVLMLLAACAGDTTAPEVPATRTTSATPIGFRIIPGTVTIEIDQQIRFRGEMRTLPGRVSIPQLAWEASGGSIDSLGNYSSPLPGTYRVVGRGRGRGRGHTQRPDTSVVVVVPRIPGVLGVRVSPRAPKLHTGESHSFTAVGRLANRTTAPIGVTWTASGGTIDPSGLYQAGSTAGTFHVIATNLRGTFADTVRVFISVPTMPDTLPDPTPEPAPDPAPEPAPEPTPQPEPVPTLARVVLRPASLVLATRATHQFAAFGRNNLGDSVAIHVVFSATGGTITPTGLYTAGRAAGAYKVIASLSGLADTALITLGATSGGGAAPPSPGIGIPFGPTGNLLAGTSAVAPFTAAVQGVNPGNILTYIAKARRAKIRLELNMTGGHHDRNYALGGDRFDLATWKKRMDEYNTPAIKAEIAKAVAEGTIIGNSVMDEPHVSGAGDGNTWGPPGTMTKAVVDQMCGYVKAMFPTLPVGVAHRHDAFEPTKSYRVCEFVITQYASRLGSITAFRDGALALARRDGHAILFSLNVMNGGEQDRTGAWDCPNSARGTYSPNCRMTPEQIRENGLFLGPAGCGLLMWRFDEAFMANPDNQQAFKDVAARLATLPGKSCSRG